MKRLSFVDLVSKHHAELRQEVLQRYEMTHNRTFNSMETRMINILSSKKMSVSELARETRISRQGTHQWVKKLDEEGYISTDSNSRSKRDRILVLTKKGETLHSEMESIKRQIDEELESNLGKENFQLMKKIMQQSWTEKTK